jgi:hypothetical protein
LKIQLESWEITVVLPSFSWGLSSPISKSLEILESQRFPGILFDCQVVDLPLKKMMEFVSWDDDIPNMMGIITTVQNHQPAIFRHSHMENHALRQSLLASRFSIWKLLNQLWIQAVSYHASKHHGKAWRSNPQATMKQHEATYLRQ